MRSFDDTTAAKIPDDDYETSQFGETNWLAPSAIVDKFTMILLSANVGDTGPFGAKTYVHWCIDEDTEVDIEYTSSFGPKSKVWDQIAELLKQQAKGIEVFPLRCSLAMVGKTYKLVGPIHRQQITTAATAGPERKPTTPRPAAPRTNSSHTDEAGPVPF